AGLRPASRRRGHLAGRRDWRGLRLHARTATGRQMSRLGPKTLEHRYWATNLEEGIMKRKAINPDNMYGSTHFGFSHAVEQNGGRTLHLSGQVAWNAAGELVGAGDLAAQT